MATPLPLVLRWGIISTGNISTSFVKDILLDPRARGTHDVAHKVTALGSRTIEGANAFLDKLHIINVDESVKIYGNYAEVYNDPDVDAIYIGLSQLLVIMPACGHRGDFCRLHTAS